METINISLKKEDLSDEFQLININNYQEKYVRADPIFYYSKEQNKIDFSFDSLDWGDFLTARKLCDNFSIYFQDKKNR